VSDARRLALIGARHHRARAGQQGRNDDQTARNPLQRQTPQTVKERLGHD
jgi:hypothetical protein